MNRVTSCIQQKINCKIIICDLYLRMKPYGKPYSRDKYGPSSNIGPGAASRSTNRTNQFSPQDNTTQSTNQRSGMMSNERGNPTRNSQQLRPNGQGMQFKYINPQNVSQKSKQSARANQMYAQRTNMGPSSLTTQQPAYLQDMMQQNQLHLSNGRQPNRSRGNNATQGQGAAKSRQQIEFQHEESLTPEPGFDEQELEQPLFNRITAQMAVNGNQKAPARKSFQNTQQPNKISITRNRQANNASQNSQRFHMRSERSMSSGMSGFSNVSNFGYPKTSNQPMQVKQSTMNRMPFSPQYDQYQGPNTMNPKSFDHDTLNDRAEDSYSQSRKTQTAPVNRQQKLRNSQPAIMQRASRPDAQRHTDRGGFFSPAPQGSGQPMAETRYKPLTPTGFANMDAPEGGLRSGNYYNSLQRNQQLQHASNQLNGVRQMQQSHQNPLQQNNRYSQYNAYEEDEMVDLEVTSDVDEHPSFENQDINLKMMQKKGRNANTNIQVIKQKNSRPSMTKTQKVPKAVTTAIKSARGKKQMVFSLNRSTKPYQDLSEGIAAKKSSVIKNGPNKSGHQQRKMTNSSSQNLSRQDSQFDRVKSLRKTLEQKRNILLLKNQRFFDRMQIDNRSQMLIHKLLQDKIEEIIVLQSSQVQSRQKEKNLYSLQQVQNETLNKILQNNQNKSFNHTREIKERLVQILKQLESDGVQPENSTTNERSMNNSKLSSSIADSKRPNHKKFNQTSRPKRDNNLLPPSGQVMGRTPDDSKKGLSDRVQYQQRQLFDMQNKSNQRVKLLSKRLSDNSRNLQIINEEHGTREQGHSRQSKSRQNENFDDSYDRFNAFKETPIPPGQQSNDLSLAIQRADDQFQNNFRETLSQGRNQQQQNQRYNNLQNDQRISFNQARSIDGNRNHTKQGGGPTSVASMQSLERTIRSGGGMKGYLNFNSNQNQTANSNMSRRHSNFSGMSGFSQNSPRIMYQGDPTSLAQIPGKSLQKFNPKSPGLRHSYHGQAHQPSLASMVQNSISGQTNPQKLNHQNHSQNRFKGLINQNISEQNMDLDNIEGQSTIIRGLNDSSGMVVTRSNLPNTPQTAHVFYNQNIGQSIPRVQKSEFDKIMDTEENTLNRQNDDNDMQFGDSRRSSRRYFQEGQDEYDVPEESNQAQMGERGTFSQGGFSVTRDGLRQSMHSQMQIHNAQSLQKSLNKTQISQITSQERKRAREQNSENMINNTTTQMGGRKQNFDIRTFNPYPNHSNNQTEDQIHEISNIKVQKSPVKMMLSARDKNSIFNLPGRQFANSPYNANSPYKHELGAQPVSYSSLPQKPSDVQSPSKSPRGANIVKYGGPGGSGQVQDLSIRSSKNGNQMGSPKSRTSRQYPKIDIQDEERSIHETLSDQEHVNPKQATMSKVSDTIQLNERVHSPQIYQANSRLRMSPDGQLSTRRYNQGQITGSGTNTQFLNAKKSINKPSNYEKNLPRHLQVNLDDTNTALNDTGQIGEGLKTMPKVHQAGLPMGANRPSNIGPFGPAGLATGAQCCKCNNGRAFSNPRNDDMQARGRALSPRNISDNLLPVQNYNSRQNDLSSHSPSGSLSKRNRRKSRVSTVNSRGASEGEDEYNISMSQHSGARNKRNEDQHDGLGRYGINGHEICGPYCKYLTPDQERALILELIRSNIADFLNSNTNNQNLHPNPLNQIVSEAEMREFAQTNNSLNLMTAHENDKRYMIQADWWREWCDYTNFDLSQLSQVNKEFTTRTRKGTGDSKYSNITGGVMSITDKQNSMGHRGSIDQKKQALNRHTLGAIAEQKSDGPFGQDQYANEEDSIRVDSEVKNLFGQPKQSQVSLNSVRSRRSRGDSAIKGSFNFGQTQSKVTIDSEKQRNIDFKAELQNLKNMKKLEKQQIKQDETESNQSGSPASKRERAMTQFAGVPLSSRNRNSSRGQTGRNQNTYYKRPQVIRNSELLKDPNSYMMQRGKGTPQQMSNMYVFLKDDLIEHFDFEAVNPEIWAYFKSWYDCDLQLLRFVKNDNVNSNQLYLDLYPEKRVAQGQVNQN